MRKAQHPVCGTSWGTDSMDGGAGFRLSTASVNYGNDADGASHLKQYGLRKGTCLDTLKDPKT